MSSSPKNRTNHSLVGHSVHRINPARLAQFVLATVDVVVPMVPLAHPMPGQFRKEHRDTIGIVLPAAFRAFVQVLWQHEIELDGVQIIAEAEVGGEPIFGAEQDDGVVVREDVVTIIDEVAVLVHRSESAVPVEDVVVRQLAIYSLTTAVGNLTALSLAGAELSEELLMSRDLIGKACLLQPAHVLLASSLSAPVTYEGVDVRLLEGLGQACSLGVVPRLTRVLRSKGIRQTLPEALRDGVANFVKLRDSVAYLLAVRCKHIFAIGEHPVEARAAGDYVLARRIVVDGEHIVALSAGESVYHGVTVFAGIATQEVVTN